MVNSGEQLIIRHTGRFERPNINIGPSGDNNNTLDVFYVLVCRLGRFYEFVAFRVLFEVHFVEYLRITFK